MESCGRVRSSMYGVEPVEERNWEGLEEAEMERHEVYNYKIVVSLNIMMMMMIMIMIMIMNTIIR